MEWDYKKRTCRLTMDGYVAAVLQKFNHPKPTKRQHSPHQHRAIVYGQKEQETTPEDTSPPLDAAGVNRVQRIVGALLYYARAVDNKLLATLSAIGAQQAAATENTLKACNQLLDYGTLTTESHTVQAIWC